MIPPARARAGIVGGGAAGLTTAWLLQSRHEVTLLERMPRRGGHVDTVEVGRDGRRVRVETGRSPRRAPSRGRARGATGVGRRHGE